MGVHSGFARLNTISICTGGGGLDLGIELAVPGYRPVSYVEREAFACAHLVAAMRQGLMAQAPVWSDARTFPGRRFRGRVDCVVGGIPCQPHSVAGKRRGRNDERDLWSPFRRILVQSGAWCALIENVPGMVTSGGLERVWRDLRRLGFAVEAGLVSAEEVGASHGRERLFVLAVHEEAFMAHGNGQRFQGLRPDPDAPRREDARRQAGLCGRAVLVDAEGERRREGRAKPEFWRGWRAGSCDGKPVADDPCSGGGPISIQPGRQDQTCADVDGGCFNLADAWGLAGEQRRGADEIGRRAGEAEQAGMGGGRMVNSVSIRPTQRGHDYGRDVGNVPDAASQWPLFAPGPDSPIWRDVGREAPGRLPATTQSTLRGVADGLAGSLDADRIDALRMLGNGVVPLAAAHAVRSLGVALARRHDADPAGFLWGVR